MRSELESEVWQLVQQTCDVSSFTRLVEEAVESYTRAPGLDSPVRVYASAIGVMGIQVLRHVLESRGHDTGVSQAYIQLRSRLRTHVSYQLQAYLVSSERAVDEMKEDLLGKDLGL